MKRNIRAIWKALPALATGLFVAVFPANVGAQFVPVEALVHGETRKLDFAPSKVLLGEASAFAIGQTAKGLGVVVSFDPETLQERTRVDLSLKPEEFVLSVDGKFLFIVGNDGKKTSVLALDGNLRAIGELDLPTFLGFPTATLTATGQLIIGGLRTASSDGAFVAVDASDPRRLKLAGKTRSTPAWRGVTNVWIADSENTIFLSGATEVGIFAVDSLSENLLSEISYQSTRAVNQEPFSGFGLMADNPCRATAGTSFLIADNARDIFILADYDESFRTLDILAQVRTSPKLVKGARAEIFPGTRIVQPASLIASSCDQSVIWLGSRLSTQVTQFARNPDASLEKVGTIRLNFQPSDLIISPDGSFALAVSQDHRAIARFNREATTRGISGGVIGDESVRELQRLLAKSGLPVGSIDGIIGSRTLRAVQIVEKRYGIQLDVTNDLDGTLNTLRKTLGK